MFVGFSMSGGEKTGRRRIKVFGKNLMHKSPSSKGESR
jgi:hypothetical protein